MNWRTSSLVLASLLTTALIAETLREAEQRSKSSNLQLPDYPAKGALLARLRSDLASEVAEDLRGACRELVKLGTCPAKKPTALVIYDPYYTEFKETSDEKKEQIERAEPDAECELYRMEMQAKGYCVEGLRLLSPKTLPDQLAAKPSLKHRYARVLLTDHGEPGVFEAPYSTCELAAATACKKRHFENGIKFRDCVEEVSTDGSLAKACPCSAEHRKYSRYEESAGEKGASVDALYAASEAWLQCVDQNPGAYSRSLPPNHLADFVKGDGQLLTMSCTTGYDPALAATLASKVCSTAPDGVVFNLSKTLNEAPTVCSPEVLARCGISCTLDMCHAGYFKYKSAEQQAYVDFFAMNHTWLIEKNLASLICYQCRDQSAHVLPDCASLDNPLLRDVPYAEVPQAIKDDIDATVRADKLESGPASLIPEP